MKHIYLIPTSVVKVLLLLTLVCCTKEPSPVDDEPPVNEEPQVEAKPQYLLFQIFSGGPNPQTGVFTKGISKAGFETAADRIL